MTLTGKRAEIAAALSTVADVIGYPYRPSAPAPGDAWPLLGPMDRAAGDAFIATWVVRVFIGSSEQAATEWWDEHWAALYFALQPVGFVDRARPILLPIGGVDQYAFEITLRSEE